MFLIQKNYNSITWNYWILKEYLIFSFDAEVQVFSFRFKKICKRYRDSSPSNKIGNKGLFEAAFSGTKTVTGVHHEDSLY